MGGLGMNLASWRAWGRHVYFLEGFSPAVWVSVVCASLFGLMCALMLRYLDNAVRCFSGVAQMLVTVVASRLLPRRLHEEFLWPTGVRHTRARDCPSSFWGLFRCPCPWASGATEQNATIGRPGRLPRPLSL